MGERKPEGSKLLSSERMYSNLTCEHSDKQYVYVYMFIYIILIYIYVPVPLTIISNQTLFSSAINSSKFKGIQKRLVFHPWLFGIGFHFPDIDVFLNVFLLLRLVNKVLHQLGYLEAHKLCDNLISSCAVGFV